MITQGMDAEPYFRILNALIRQDGTEAEQKRTDEVVEWLQRARYTVEKVCDATEVATLGVIVSYWMRFRNCPSREILQEQVNLLPKSKNILDLLSNYDKYSRDWKPLDQVDMEYHLSRRTTDFESCRLLQILDNATQITAGSVANPASKPGHELPPLQGTKDAVGYLMERFQKGILVNDTRADGGLLSEHTSTLQKVYDAHRQARLDGKLWIPTGIPLIDLHLGGLRRKEMYGVLGYTGQRKSAVVRTMAYNAARSGFRVLHIPLESDFVEELSSYSVMYAHATANKVLSDLTRRRFDSGDMTDAEYHEFMTVVVPNFGLEVGSNLTVYDPKSARTWAAIKGVIERENYIQQLDLVIVDYLTLLGDPLSRDQVASKILMVQDAKQLALNSGFCLVTPVQGNRKGYEDAVENDGAWDLTGIATYSELDKSLDNCLYVFSNEYLSSNGELKIGSCKHRRGSDIPATAVPINNHSGMLMASNLDSLTSEITLPSSIPADPTPAEASTFFSYMDAA